MSGESIGGAAGELRRIADAVPSGAAADLGDMLERIRDQLGVLVGAEHELTEHAGQLTISVESVFRDLMALREMLSATADHHLGSSSSPGPSSVPSAPSGGPAPAERSPVRAADGSEYPAAAAWAADVLPRRVRAGEPGEKTTGYADGEIGQPFTSGNDAAWSPAIEQRLRTSGEAVDVARRLKSHVELKIAAMMRARGRTHSEAVINHVPCGSQRGEDYRGCHDTLSAFLPEGATLTVHGTTQEGTPETHTYRGSA